VSSDARGGGASARAIQFFQSGIHGNASEDRLSYIPNAWVWCAEGDHARLEIDGRRSSSGYGRDVGTCVSAAMRFLRVSVRLAFLTVVVIAPLAAEEPEVPLREAYLLWQVGYQLHLAGAYEEAIKRFEASIELHPTPEAHTFLGWSMSYLGRLEEAIEECQKAIAIDPDYGNPYNDNRRIPDRSWPSRRGDRLA
jgi:tetratricopeptide (TPR) repeat protein